MIHGKRKTKTAWHKQMISLLKNHADDDVVGIDVHI